MYKTMITSVFLSLLAIFSFSNNASNTSNAPIDEAQAAYSEALNGIRVARASFAEGHRMSFVEVSEDHDGNPVSSTKLLHLTVNGDEVITSASDADSNVINSGTESDSDSGSEMNWQSAILVDPERFPERAALLRETDSHWVFILPAMVKVNMEASEQSVDSHKVNSKVSSALLSELTVSKQKPQFLSLETYSQKPFKPDTLVRVKEFRVSIDYAQAWENGPLVARSFSRRLKGNYALFMSVEEQSSITYQQFQLLE